MSFVVSVLNTAVAAMLIALYIRYDAYTFHLPRAVFVCILGFLTMFLASGYCRLSPVMILAVCINLCMLMVTSYMDMQTANFNVIILVVAFVSEAAVYLLFFCGKFGFMPIIVLFGFLFLLWFSGLSLGDVLIYASCSISFFIIDTDSLSSVVVLLGILFLSSNVLGLLCNLPKLFNKKTRREAFPFTTYIYIGYCITFPALYFIAHHPGTL